MALGHSTWDNVLDVLSAALPGCLILVSGDDIAKATNIVFAQRGLRAAAVASYVNTYAALNPWSAGTSNFAQHQIYHDDQILPRDEASATEFVTNWLMPQGDYGAFTGVVLIREGARQLTLDVRYPVNRQGELREHVAAVLGEAAYHFGRAFEISTRTRFSAGLGYLSTMVEDLPFTVFFVDEEMRIQYSNFHAENMRRSNTGPFSSADGFLRGTDEHTDEMLRQLVHKIVTSSRAPTSVMQFTKPDGEGRYFAIGRLAAKAGQPYQLHDAILDPGPLVMLVVHGSHDASSLPTDLLWRSFALTDSEASLAEALLNGATLADFAREREVSKQTLRNQLVGVMRKTGTRRQSELVSLLTRLSLTCF